MERLPYLKCEDHFLPTVSLAPLSSFGIRVLLWGGVAVTDFDTHVVGLVKYKGVDKAILNKIQQRKWRTSK